jgi:S-formylglutathione hydrolase FrmB
MTKTVSYVTRPCQVHTSAVKKSAPADQPHRALAGLSLGGMEAHTIGLAHVDLFSTIGMFSGGSITPAEIKDIETFKKRVKLVFVSYGSREGGATTAKPDADALQQAGVKTVFYVSPDTAHEWQSWRRSLCQSRRSCSGTDGLAGRTRSTQTGRGPSTHSPDSPRCLRRLIPIG